MDDPNLPALSITGLSIVIPVGPGDTAWRGLVEQLSPLASRPQLLLVFADGDPQSAEVPNYCAALSASAGRAHQLNAGIAAADGQWLWLLHADSRLLPDTWPALREYLATSPRALGWFRLAFAADGPWLMALNALGANLRARWLGLPFGDQGFVLHRDDAAQLGLFDATLGFGEDHAMVWRARRIGLPLKRIDGTLATSARKYAERGWLRTTARHLRLTTIQAKHESRRT
ncbi:MAG: glycosyltransferase [Thermomonas sp.]